MAGVDVLGDIYRPRQHTWFKEAVEAGVLGTEAGAGIDALCAGGMHTLVVDEVGKVSSLNVFMVFEWSLIYGSRCGRGYDCSTTKFDRQLICL